MADIPSTIPNEVRAGDTLRWTREFTDYPASDGWALAYTLVSSTAVATINASADGDGFDVTVTAAISAAFVPGRYTITEFVTKALERVTLNIKPLRVLANLAGASAGTDVRSHARKMLEAIETWLETKSPTAASFEIAGRKLQNYPLADLLKLRDRYRAEANAEDRAAAGLAPVRLLTRF